MKSFFKIILLLLVTSTLGNVYAQTPTDSSKTEVQKFRIIKHDGTTYIGTIESDDGREVLINTEKLGKIYIPKSDIQSMTPVNEDALIVSGNYREAGPFVTRYYFTNNALPIKKGEDYAMIHLYGPEVHFSVAKNFSIGVMATWIASPIGIAMKYAIPTSNEKLNFSIGTIMLNSGYLEQAKGWGGLHWGSVTYGSPGKNVTLSSGFGYVDLRINARSRNEIGLEKLNRGSVSSIGAILPVGERASFIFDSMIAISESRNYSSQTGPLTYTSGTQVAAFLMPGMRFQKMEKRAFQVALAGVIQYKSNGLNQWNTQKTRSFPVPMCSWFFKF